MNLKINVSILILLCIIASSCNESQQGDNKTTESSAMSAKNNDNLKPLLDSLNAAYDLLRPQVIRQPVGYFKYPYLIPAGFYKQMWDWDGFFMGNHFISQGHPEHLQHWAQILLEGIDKDGYVSGCATEKGPRPIFGKFAMKPFLSQGVYFAAKAMNDFTWVAKYYDDLKKVIAYRKKTQYDEKYGLYFWEIAMQSGADNNPSLNYFQDDTRSFLACDASTFQLRELIAQSLIADKLGKTEDAKQYRAEAEALKNKINELMWNNDDKMYYNVDRETGKQYKRISYSNFIPLVQQIASPENGKAMIEKYMISSDYMKSPYGFRSLSKQDVDYNNKNVIIPFSNWQGPIWPVANYLFSIALKNYGFDNEIRWLAEKQGRLMLKDCMKYGTMHEDYNADTGEPLAPSQDHVDENGKFVGFISWNLCIQNILEGVVENKWMLLKLE